MYVIMGATGNIGGVIAAKLLAQGEKVRVIGRDAKRLETLAKKGAEPAVANATDRASLTKAFAGAKAAFVLNPPNPSVANVRDYQASVNDAIAAAVTANSVPYVLVLSSVGADKPDRCGPVVGLHDLEAKLSAISGANILSLRPAYFMENTLPQIAVIQAMGIVAGPLRPDLKFPVIATRDIGAAAADALLTLQFQGKTTRELLGPGEITYPEIAKTIGTAIGRPNLPYLQVSPDQFKGGLMQMGMSADAADSLVEMSDSLNNGYMRALEPRTSANTTATTFETFVNEVFAPAYKGKASGANT